MGAEPNFKQRLKFPEPSAEEMKENHREEPMRRLIALTILFLLLGSNALAARDIRVDQDYDPRIEMRLVVMPASMERSLNRVNPRTVSALFATELLREYEVVDLARFEQFVTDRRFDLTSALTLRAESVVRDSAQIDAIANIEIYLWDQGSGGLPLLGRQSGRVGMRIRLMDPYTGRLYWSINRVERVSPGADFLKRATVFFRDVVTDLGNELEKERNNRIKYEAAAGMGGETDIGQANQGIYTSLPSRKERGFIPLHSLSKTDLGLKTHTLRDQDRPEKREESGSLLPPLFESGYEDIEAVRDDVDQQKPGLVGTMPSETGRSGPPPLPASLRLDNLQSTTGTDGGK